MTSLERQSAGLLERLRRIGRSFLGLVEDRVRLFAVECQQEKLRLLNLLLWTGVALTLVAAGLLVVLGALALWSWQAAGYLGLVALSLATLAGAAALFWGIRRKIQLGPTPFAGTVAEFRKDAECL